MSRRTIIRLGYPVHCHGKGSMPSAMRQDLLRHEAYLHYMKDNGSGFVDALSPAMRKAKLAHMRRLRGRSAGLMRRPQRKTREMGRGN